MRGAVVPASKARRKKNARYAEHQQVEGDADDHLIGPGADGEPSEDKPEHPTRGEGGKQSQPQAAGVVDGDEGDEAAAEHHAFEADIEDAGLLGEHAAERRQQDRDRQADAGGDEAGEDGIGEEIHLSPPPSCAALRARSGR